MSDCGETDLFWESWPSPGKRKRKKASKKGKKCSQSKDNTTKKTDDNNQKKKKKKNLKFREAVDGTKVKKKEKKKKKNKVALELDGSFVFTQASSVKEKPTVTPHSDKLTYKHSTQDSKKKRKRKKKVAFDLSPGYICVKRPKFVSSSPQCDIESVLSENEAARDSESCPQVAVSGHSRGPTRDPDSQCTSEDINSQDLFITQKTFRASPSQTSSGEAVTVTHMFTQEDDTSVAQINEHLDRSYKCPQESSWQQIDTNKETNKPASKTVQVIISEEEEEEEEEEEGSNETHRKNKNGNLSFQTQMKPNTTLTEEKKAPCPGNRKPSVLNPYLADPVVVKPPEDVEKSKKRSCTTTSTSTQTENFFTTELSLYLNFCQKSRATAHSEDLKPLDLSLPERAAKNHGKPVKTPTLPDGNHEDPNVPTSCSSGTKDAEVNKGTSASTRDRGETAPSPQSESEPKSADTTVSSEDGEPQSRKLDLTQVRAVQMRLNESFFFKTKGEGRSPRPESPLMKLAQGRDVKSRKGH